jgi:hypothetical protein
MIIQTTGAGGLQGKEREHLLLMIRAIREKTLKMADDKLKAVASRVQKQVISKADFDAMLRDLADVEGLGQSLKSNAEGCRKRLNEYVRSSGDSSPLAKKR